MTGQPPWRTFGPVGFAALLAAPLVWVALGTWLSFEAERWPDRCAGYSGTKDIVGLFTTIGCSFRLLGGGVFDYALFAWIWALPVGAAAFLIAARRRRRRERLP